MSKDCRVGYETGRHLNRKLYSGRLIISSTSPSLAASKKEAIRNSLIRASFDNEL